MSKKLKLLANEQTILIEEQNANDILGNEGKIIVSFGNSLALFICIAVSNIVASKVRPQNSTKFRSYIDDIGHITMLLLSLSGRLAKTDNILLNSDLMKSEDKVISLYKIFTAILVQISFYIPEIIGE